MSMNEGLSIENFPMDVKLRSPMVSEATTAAQHASGRDFMNFVFNNDNQ